MNAVPHSKGRHVTLRAAFFKVRLGPARCVYLGLPIPWPNKLHVFSCHTGLIDDTRSSVHSWACRLSRFITLCRHRPCGHPPLCMHHRIPGIPNSQSRAVRCSHRVHAYACMHTVRRTWSASAETASARNEHNLQCLKQTCSDKQQGHIFPFPGACRLLDTASGKQSRQL